MSTEMDKCVCGEFRWQHLGDTGQGSCIVGGCHCKRFDKVQDGAVLVSGWHSNDAEELTLP